jgi:hypothetical protein
MKAHLLLPMLLALGAPARADDMSAVAGRFYSTYLALPRSGGIPNATARARYAPLLSARLNTLIDDAAMAQMHFQAKNKDSPPLFEGDLFSSLFEGFDSFRLGPCTGDTKTGHCTVALHHQDPGPPPASATGQKNDQPVDWTDQVSLVNTPAGWKVDDIAYKAVFSFGNEGLLSQTLHMVITTAK